MSVFGAEPGHFPRHSGVHPHLPNADAHTSSDHESLERIIDQQDQRIAELEGLLRQLSTEESWALTWARENEPWKRIKKILDQ